MMPRSLLAILAPCALLAGGCPDPPPPTPAAWPLVAPAAADGFQIATDAFPVAAGTEVQRCYFVTLPGTGPDPIWIDRIVAGLNPGSHHFNVFRVKTVHALDGQNGDVVDGGECWNSGNWADWPLVINTQESAPSENVVDWQLPAGVAHKFMPGEKLMLQIHYVNATTQQTPDGGHGMMNFYYYKGAATPMELGTVFATNQNIRVCPGDSNRSYSTTCRFAKVPVTIIGANGHFHSRGVEFDIDAVDGMNDPLGAPFYKSTSWSDPPFARDLHVALPANGGVGWTCTYSMPSDACADPTNMCCATFGGHVETQEHCNAFVYYYPKIDDASCF